MNKLIVLFACIAVALGAARQARDAPAAAAADPLQEIQKHAAEFQKSFSETINSITTSKNTQEVTNKLKEGSDSVLKQLSALSASLQSALTDANGKVKESLEQTRSSLQRTAEDLRRAHPEVEENAKQLQEKISAAVASTVDQTQKLAKEVAANLDQANQKLAPQLKQAYDDFVHGAEQVQKKIHDAAAKQ